MAKIVRMVAEVVADACTGCALCTFVCPTVALRMVDRPADRPGPSRRLPVIDGTVCYNAQNCLEICPDDAIRMVALDEPFEVGVDESSVDAGAVAALCLEARLIPDMRVCFCTETTAGELAAAILLGADTPEELARMTGARTGCTEICSQPTLRLLAAGGHVDAPRDPSGGFQRYGLTGRILDFVGEDGVLDDELVAEYPLYPLRKDLSVLNFDFDNA